MGGYQSRELWGKTTLWYWWSALPRWISSIGAARIFLPILVPIEAVESSPNISQALSSPLSQSIMADGEVVSACSTTSCVVWVGVLAMATPDTVSSFDPIPGYISDLLFCSCPHLFWYWYGSRLMLTPGWIEAIFKSRSTSGCDVFSVCMILNICNREYRCNWEVRNCALLTIWAGRSYL